MTRYIDADKLNGYEFGLISTKAQNLFHKTINNAPTEDVKPIVRGEWVCGYYDIIPHCSNCESEWTNSKYMNFCPTCGANMRK